MFAYFQKTIINCCTSLILADVLRVPVRTGSLTSNTLESSLLDYVFILHRLVVWSAAFRWHCTKSSDCQVRVRGQVRSGQVSVWRAHSEKAVVAYACPGQEESSRCTVKFIRSKCNEGYDWCICVTIITCADTMTYTLCIQ